MINFGMYYIDYEALGILISQNINPMDVKGKKPLISSSTHQEKQKKKNKKNKRQVQEYPPDNNVQDCSSLITQHPNCQLFSAEVVDAHDLEHHLRNCDACLDLLNKIEKEQSLDDIQDYPWTRSKTEQLKDLVLSHLHQIYQSAIEKITSYGYTIAVANNAVLVTGKSYQSLNDPSSTVADYALQYLASGVEVDTSEKENIAEDLRNLEKKALDYMVGVLKKKKPLLCTGEAMWFLLICDLNLSNACSMVFSAINYPHTSQSKLDPSINLHLNLANASSSKHMVKAACTKQFVNERKERKDQLQFVKQELQTEEEDLKKWACQKIMWVTRKLNEHQTELESLKLKSKEVETHGKEEKEHLEEWEENKISKLEEATSMCYAHIEWARSHICELEIERARLKQELDIIKKQSEEAKKVHLETFQMELDIAQKSFSCKNTKEFLGKALEEEKCKFSLIEQQIVNAKNRQSQLEDKLKNEKNSKEDVLLKVYNRRKEKEELETAAKLNENALKLQASSNKQKYDENVIRLKGQIQNMKLMINHRRRTHCVHCLDLQNNNEEINRECVMCLSEEKSILFLPCSHQVLCLKCNEQHEKQSTECPVCRSCIRRRIYPRFNS
uniref:RING-type domain-containing protein n=1 Tax=Ananas comosus var. bracteatus TaxID=296719 RepID=A0A6V7PFZ6_ANACO|nr:unnamed protein product [Ananas comosus var. bracteatus]